MTDLDFERGFPILLIFKLKIKKKGLNLTPNARDSKEANQKNEISSVENTNTCHSR